MARKQIVLWLLLGLVVLIFIGSYLLLRVKLASRTALIPLAVPAEESTLLEPSIPSVGDPVIKRVGRDKSFVEWEVRGYFEEPLKTHGQFLKGRFIIEGDGTKRPFEVILGSADGYLLTTETSSASATVEQWRLVPFSQVMDKVKTGNVVTLFIEWHQDGDLSQEKLRGMDAFWSKVTDSIRSTKALDRSLQEPDGSIYAVKAKI